jgi:hypothetical protein
MSWLIACALGVQRTTDILNSGRGWLKKSYLFSQFSQGVVVEASLKGLIETTQGCAKFGFRH